MDALVTSVCDTCPVNSSLKPHLALQVYGGSVLVVSVPQALHQRVPGRQLAAVLRQSVPHLQLLHRLLFLQLSDRLLCYRPDIQSYTNDLTV